MDTRPVITDLWICFLRELAYYNLQGADFYAETGLDGGEMEHCRAQARNLDVLAAWVERYRNELPELPAMNAPATVTGGKSNSGR